MDSFKDNLRRVRREKRLTQAGLARRSGVSARSIAYYEAGTFAPAGKQLVKLANALGVEIDLLLKEKTLG